MGFGALVALMLLALSQAGLQLRQVNAVSQNFATEDMQRLLRVQALSLQTEGVGSALIRLMNAPRESRVAEYAEVDERNRRIDAIIASLVEDLADPQQVQTLARLIAVRASYSEAFIATVDQVEAEDSQAAARTLNETFNPALKAMLVESNALLARERQQIEARLGETQSHFETVAKWVGVLSLLVMVLAAALAWATTRSVVVPLAQLEGAALAIAAGDYSSQFRQTGTQEVDRVGDALNSMTGAVAQRELQIARLAYHDPLTGLPNRTALLSPARAPVAAPNCLVLMDLARLKVVNETLGYAIGDTLIGELAARASAVFHAAARDGLIGPDPVVARLSGGTFAAAFIAQDRAAVERLRIQIGQVMAAPAVCAAHSVDLGVTCGFAGAGSGSRNQPVGVLMRNAEVALHSAKRSAMGHAWYSEAQEAARLGHLNLISDLRAAVASSQLQMWLQPKIGLPGGKAVGVEALVRWQHPQRGFVSPAEFIPFAEQTGHIIMVTDWMLSQAVQTLVGWAGAGLDLSIAVNISTRDLQDQEFAGRVGGLVAKHGVDPQRLRLEITESGLMADAKAGVALLERLREIGVGLSIDDFGTGYSSLAYLQKLPVSELKIDRGFVDRIDASPGTQKLVKAMVEMGHGMDLVVTAEGVETEAERATIERLGFDVMQGYLVARPLHGAALRAWLESL